MSLSKLLQNFKNPPSEFSAVPFWFWNDTLTKEKIRAQILDMKSHGIDAFVIHPRIGLPKELSYMSDEFLDFVEFAAETAQKNDMFVVLYDEGMYPSGSANGGVVKKNPDFAVKCLVQTLGSAENTVSAPKINEGEKLILSLAVKIEDERLVCAKKITPGGAFLEKDLNKWQFAHYIMRFSESTIRGIHFGEDDGEPDAPKAANLMDINATYAFISLTHEKYYSRLKRFFGNTVKAIFTGEPSPIARGSKHGSVAWTDDFLNFLSEKLDILLLPVLFLKTDPRFNEVFKIYDDTVARLMGERFFAPISKWCKEHNIALTGHPGKSYDIGHMKYFQAPCQDIVWRYIEPSSKSAVCGEHSVMGKCTSDAARHRLIRRNGNEALGCCGRKENLWDMPLSDVKWYFDWLFARGVNLVYPHAFFYSVTKPRYDERPPDVGFNSSWWSRWGEISAYVKRMCCILTDSTNAAETAILCDVRDMPSVCASVLFTNQIEFNYLEKELLPLCRAENGKVTIAKQGYKNIIVENKTLLDEKIAALLKGYEKCGVKIYTAFDGGCFTYALPEKLPLYIQTDVSFYPHFDNLRISTVIKEGERLVLLFNEGETDITGELKIKNAAETEELFAQSGNTAALTSPLIKLKRRESRIIRVAKTYKKYVLDPVVKREYAFSPVKNKEVCVKACYKTEFTQKTAGKTLAVFCNVHGTLTLFVNKKKLPLKFAAPYEYDISDYLTDGKNTIEAAVTFSSAQLYSAEETAGGIFGECYILSAAETTV